MEHLKQETVSGTQLNLDALYKVCPQCFTESKDPKTGEIKHSVDFDKLRLLLGDNVAEGDERYDFTWVGKRAALQEAARPIRKTLRPCPEESVDWDNTKNLYIEGDNLEVLKLLQNSYMGKVKMIYIDPPYNTGNDFLYHDDFAIDYDVYEFEAGNIDDEKNRYRKNLDSNGRFHSAWCSMIYSRLLIARSLLTEDGVIFISIDDNEVENLQKICNEVFGADNYVNTISLKLKNIAGASGGGEDKRLKKNMEYILLYSKNYESLVPFENVYSYTPIGELVQKYREEGISWKYTSVLTSPGEKKYIGETFDGDGNSIKIYERINYSIKSISQIIKEEKITEVEAYNKYSKLIFQTQMPQSSIRPRVMEKVKEIGSECDLFSIEYTPRSGRNKGVVYEQFYKGDNFRLFAWLRDVAEEIDGCLYKKDLQGTLWDFVSETKNLAKEGDIPYPNGKKPVKMIKQMLEMNTKDDDLILDFFSGSASTAHAVLQLNSEDRGNRKFIMVQWPEEIENDSDANIVGYKNICEIGKERIRRAGKKILDEQKAYHGDLFSGNHKFLDVGFRVFKCEDSNMKDVYYTPAEYSQELLLGLEDNIKEDRNELDLLFGCMLEWGVTLDLPLRTEKIDSVTIHIVNDGDLVACFNQNIPETAIERIASLHPMRVVLRDNCFKEAKEKMNFFEIFKQRTGWSEEEVRKNVKVL